MTKVKLCGLSRPCDIEYANEIKPDFIGFVFFEKSIRNVSFEKAHELRQNLADGITPVGVFVDEDIENVAKLLNNGTISIAQLHGNENNEYIANLRKLADYPIIQAFRIKSDEDIERANNSTADYILLDSGWGTGQTFDHSFIKGMKRDFFIAGGINADNIGGIIEKYRPFGADVSSAIETDGVKDKNKMRAFVDSVRKVK
ncbi:MAG: phosphoribosylanthranilate isomerase [Ruminococcus sp.]|nr:phosphoribosylanthranilate isomerase [Ruminococcus sp.]